MIDFEFRGYRVISEVDFVEDNKEQIECTLEVSIGVVGDVGKVVPTVKREIVVINNNSQTGKQMDEQRENECIAYVAANFTT